MAVRTRLCGLPSSEHKHYPVAGESFAGEERVRGAVTRTIRVDGEVDKLLRGFAEREGVSVNFLVGRSVKKYVEWDAHAEKFGFVAFPSSIVGRMMTYLTDQEARELGDWVGRNFIRQFLLFWFKKVDLETLLAGFPRLVAQYTRAFEYAEFEDGGTHAIVFNHAKGPRWSIYYEAVARGAFETLLGKEVKTERSEDQVVVRFRVA